MKRPAPPTGEFTHTYELRTLQFALLVLLSTLVFFVAEHCLLKHLNTGHTYFTLTTFVVKI